MSIIYDNQIHMNHRTQLIPVSRLEPHPDNPRKSMDPQKIQELAESIRANGVFQNLTVVPILDPDDGCPTDRYRVVIGHRRLAACKVAGVGMVPCVVADNMTPAEQLRTMMVENMQRAELTPIEEAEGFQQLMLDMGDTVAEIAEYTGVSQTTIRSRLKLAELPKEKAAAGLERGATIRDFLKLDEIKDPKKKEAVLDKIGTADFNEALRKAKARQDLEEYMHRILEDLAAADWIQGGTNQPNFSQGWQYVTYYGECNQKPLTKPEDLETMEYRYYDVTWNNIAIYRRPRANAQKISKADRIEDLRNKYVDKLEATYREIEWEGQNFRDLREEFMDEFGRGARYQEEIQVMAIYALLYGSNIDLDPEECMNAMGIGMYDIGKISRKKLVELLSVDTAGKLVQLVYMAMEDMVREPWHTMKDGDIHGRYPVFNYSKSMSDLYAFLADLGYQISKEEEAYLQGSCMQYIEAQKVIEEFREELKKIL